MLLTKTGHHQDDPQLIAESTRDVVYITKEEIERLTSSLPDSTNRNEFDECDYAEHRRWNSGNIW